MERLKGALIGFGFIAERGHAPAYASAKAPLDIVAVAEPCRARRPAIERALPHARIYGDHETLLAKEAIEFVDVCAPPSEHARIAQDALSRGLHVLCEKPLAMNAREARSMADRARRAGRVLYPSHSYRHAPVIRAVRGILSHDRIGTVRMVTMDTFRTGHARGVVEWQPDWRRDPRWSGGGILMDHGPHTAYLAFEWLRDYPTAVRAWTHTLGGGEVEDEATFSLSFPAGIVRAHLSWNAGFRRVIYTLHGDRGAIRVEDDELELVLRAPDGRSRTEKSSLASNWSDAGHASWFEGVLSDFAKSVQTADFVGRDTEDAVRAMEVVSAAFASAKGGGTEVPLEGAPMPERGP